MRIQHFGWHAQSSRQVNQAELSTVLGSSIAVKKNTEDLEKTSHLFLFAQSTHRLDLGILTSLLLSLSAAQQHGSAAHCSQWPLGLFIPRAICFQAVYDLRGHPSYQLIFSGSEADLSWMLLQEGGPRIPPPPRCLDHIYLAWWLKMGGRRVLGVGGKSQKNKMKTNFSLVVEDDSFSGCFGSCIHLHLWL